MVDVATSRAPRVGAIALNGIFGTPCEWSSDSQRSKNCCVLDSFLLQQSRMLVEAAANRYYLSTLIHDLPETRLSCCRARVAAPKVSRGNNFRKVWMRFASNRKFGGNCQRIGPSFTPRRSSPDAKKFARGFLMSFSRKMWVI
jgi:hypothetical protein